MRLERRDRLVAAAMLTREHKFAKGAIADYEIEPPRRSYDQYAVRNLKYRHQEELMHYWKKGIRAMQWHIRYLDGFSDYEFKFPYMINDTDKSFLKAVQATLEKEPLAIGYPCAYKEDPAEKTRLQQLKTGRATLPETMSSEIPSFDDWKQARLQYTEKQASFQTVLQRRTSELTLTSAPPVEAMTPLMIAKLKIEQTAESDFQKKQTATADVLTFAENILQAQLFKGSIYDGLTEEEKEIFQETVNTVPPRERIEWLVDKLERVHDLTYEMFLNNISFVHVQNSFADGKCDKEFVLNYIHQKHLVPCKL